MKQFLLFFPILFSLFAKAQTSVYHPFPDSAIVWRESFGAGYPSGCGSSYCVTEKNYQYFLAGDVDIDGVIYKRILKNGYTHYYTSGGLPCSGCDATYYHVNEYSGSIRQDIPQRKVYYQSTFETGEVLLYDFNLNIGDTLPESLINPFIDNYVSVIDSVLIGINYHKRFWISQIAGPSNYTSLIEGIGGDMGLLSTLQPPFESGSSLMCASIDGIPIYPDTATICATITGIKPRSRKTEFSLAPNPFNSASTLTVNRALNNGEMRIYNSLGQQVKKVENISEQNIIIQRDNLPEGVYFLQLIQENKLLTTGKFIITND